MSMQGFLKSTTQIVKSGKYFASQEAFFSNFGTAFEAARSTVLKLETRSFYNESGNPSFDAMMSGDFEGASSLIPETKLEDKQDYDQLAARYVEFIRCRPITMPLNDYLKWEFLNYDINISYGERIFIINSLGAGDIFDTLALHDFMVFDARFGFVHDYDEAGKLIGGWSIENPEDICALIALHSYIRSNSVDFLSIYPNGFSEFLSEG